MKIGGKEIKYGPQSEIIVFPRGDETIALKATALVDRTEFDRLYPAPKPPVKRIKGGEVVPNPDDPRFKTAVEAYNAGFMDYLVIASLSAPPDKEGEPDQEIEWGKVDKLKRSTWHFWDEDFQDAGFSDMERKRIYTLVATVNSLSEARMDEARATFFRRQSGEPDELSYPQDEQNDTPSGGPASDSESDLPAAQ